MQSLRLSRECPSPPFPTGPDSAELSLGQAWRAVVCCSFVPLGPSAPQSQPAPFSSASRTFFPCFFPFSPLFSLTFLWAPAGLSLPSWVLVLTSLALCQTLALGGVLVTCLVGPSSACSCAQLQGLSPAVLLCPYLCFAPSRGHGAPQSACCGLEPLLPGLLPLELRDLLCDLASLSVMIWI